MSQHGEYGLPAPNLVFKCETYKAYGVHFYYCLVDPVQEQSAGSPVESIMSSWTVQLLLNNGYRADLIEAVVEEHLQNNGKSASSLVPWYSHFSQSFHFLFM